MQRKFITNLVFLLSVNLLVKPFWIFGIDRTVQNTLGTEAYGVYFALFNLSMLFNIIIDMGITNYNNRSVAMDHSTVQAKLTSILVVKIILSVFYAVVTFVLAFIWKFDTYQLYLLSLLVLNQVISSFILYFRSNLSGMHLFRIDSILSVADKLLMIVFCGVLLWGQPFGSLFKLDWYIYAQTLSFGIVFLVSAILVGIYSSGISFSVNRQQVINVIKQTYPFAMLGLLMTIYYRLDALMIERLLGEQGKIEAGIYAAGYRILDALNMSGYLFAGLLLPIFSKMLGQGERPNKLLKLSFNLLMTIAIAVSIPSYFSRQNIIDLLYTDASIYMADVFGWLVLCFITISMVYIFGSLLTANASMKQLNFIALFGVICNVTLNLILIPKYKALGATWATFITQLLVAGLHIYFTKKIFKTENLGTYFYKLAVLFFMATLIGLAGQFIVATIILFIIEVLAILLLAFILKIVDIKDVGILIKSNR